MILRALLSAWLVLNLAACSSMQTVSVEQAMATQAPAGVDIGSKVEVRTLDGRRAVFRVTDITPDGIGGSPGHFPYENMASLKVEPPRSDPDNTWAWVIGVAAAVALVVLVANSDSAAICGGTSCPNP